MNRNTEPRGGGMNGLAKFDYGELGEHEVNTMERRAESIAGIRATVTRSAIETGRILRDARDRLANRRSGGFESWAESRAGISPRHARRFIDVANRFQTSDINVRSFDDTSLFLLAAPSCPESAVKEAMRLADHGKIVSSKVAKSIIEKHKPAKQDNPPGYSPHGIPGRKRKAKATEQEPDEPDESPGVIETTARMVESDGETDELTVRDEFLAAWKSAKKLPDSLPVKAQCLSFASRIVEMLSTGEPEEDDEPTVKESLTVAPEPVQPVARTTPDKPRSRKDQIEAIYKAYPRKVAPQAAKKAIAKALDQPDVTFGSLLEAVEEYARSRVGKDQKFTPHPATWFNRGSYHDDREDWHRSDKPDDQWEKAKADIESPDYDDPVGDRIWGKVA